MRRGIAIGVAFGAMVAACFSSPARPGGDAGMDPGGDGRWDAVTGDGAFVSVDGNPASCTTDLFLGSGDATCGPSGWGTLVGSGYGTLTDTTTGELNLGLPGIGTEQCSSQPDAWRRVTVDVQAVAASTAAERTFIGIASLDDTRAWGVEFVYDSTVPGTALKTSCMGVSAVRALLIREWNPTTQRYIQIERTDPMTLAFSASPDNVTFTPVGSCTVTEVAALATARVRLSIALTANEGTDASAKFGHIELCHD